MRNTHTLYLNPQRGTIAPRLFAIIFGLVVMGLASGWLLLVLNTSKNTNKDMGGGWLALACPTCIIFGLTVFVRGLISNKEIYWPRIILTTGLLMLAVGAYPWIYTDLLIGDRPGNEGAGMLGTLLFISVGVPGLFITILGAFIGGLQGPD
jgi:hypothetical protein